MYPTPSQLWAGTFVEQQVKGLLAAGVQVQVLHFDRKQEGPLVYYRMAQRIGEATREFDPHLIHVMYGGVMAERIVTRHTSRPILVTFHGSDLLGENLSGMLRKLVARYGVRCSWAAARRAQGVVVVAHHLEKTLPPDVDRRKVRVIPCGIDLERFKPMDQNECRRKLGWNPGTLHVLFPANAGDPVKRPWIAQAAVRILQEQGVKAELHLLTGIPNTEVPCWINASDVLLLTSLHEGSPMVVKECLACNVPVVSVDVGDVKERISQIAGCHLASSQPQDVAAKLNLVHQRKGRVCGREHIRDLSIGQVAGKLASFYDETLSKVG